MEQKSAQKVQKIDQKFIDQHPLRFTKNVRLRRRQEYKKFFNSSSRFRGESIFIDIRQGKGPSPKLGITVSRRYGKAHARNRFKRLVREAFRTLLPSLRPGLELHITPNKGIISLKTVVNDVKRAAEKSN